MLAVRSVVHNSGPDRDISTTTLLRDLHDPQRLSPSDFGNHFSPVRFVVWSEIHLDNCSMDCVEIWHSS